MHLTKLYPIIATVILVSLPMPSTADKIADDAVNSYFANYQLIIDHPECSRPGHLAYRTTFEAQNLMRDLHQEEDGTSEVDISNDPECFVIQRRGTEQTKQAIQCEADYVPDKRPTKAERRAANRSIAENFMQTAELSLSADIVTCQTLTKFALIDGAWSATLTNGIETTEHAGSFRHSSDETCSTPKALQGPFAIVRLDTGHPRFYPSVGLGANPSDPISFHIYLGGIPVPSSPEVEVGAATFFFPIRDGQTACPEGVCRTPSFASHWYDVGRPWSCN